MGVIRLNAPDWIHSKLTAAKGSDTWLTMLLESAASRGYTADGFTPNTVGRPRASDQLDTLYLSVEDRMDPDRKKAVEAAADGARTRR